MEKKYPYLSEDGKTIFLAPGFQTETKEEWEKREQLPPPAEIHISPFTETETDMILKASYLSGMCVRCPFCRFEDGKWTCIKNDAVESFGDKLYCGTFPNIRARYEFLLLDEYGIDNPAPWMHHIDHLHEIAMRDGWWIDNETIDKKIRSDIKDNIY